MPTRKQPEKRGIEGMLDAFSGAIKANAKAKAAVKGKGNKRRSGFSADIE